MAAQLNYQAESYPSAIDLSSVTTPLFMSLDSTGRATICSASSYAEGILENAPPIANVATISYLGVTKLTVDAAYARGTFLMSGATGIGTQGSTGVGGYSPFTRAVTLEDSSASGNIITVRLVDSNR
jgi:hypothetical protein